jgi:hypothetical protein
VSTAEARALWTRLSAAGLTVGHMPEAIDAHTPWYVRVMLSIAGFIAAVFLMAFVAFAFRFVLESREASAAVGLMLITAAYALFRAATRSDFVAMFALAVSFAGQGLFFMGFTALFAGVDKTAPWIVIAGLEAALTLLMPNFIHRVVCAFAAGFALAYALSWAGAALLAPGVIGAIVAWIWLNEARYARRASVAIPAGYGLTLAFVYIQAAPPGGMIGLYGLRIPIWLPVWFGEAMVGAALVSTVAALVRRTNWRFADRKALLAVIAAAAVAAASLNAPGIAGGLMIALLGFANGNRVLTGIGIAALLFYVSRYYYLLDITLLEKSAALAATGAVLLGARWIVLNLVMADYVRDA